MQKKNRVMFWYKCYFEENISLKISLTTNHFRIFIERNLGWVFACVCARVFCVCVFLRVCVCVCVCVCIFSGDGGGLFSLFFLNSKACYNLPSGFFKRPQTSWRKKEKEYNSKGNRFKWGETRGGCARGKGSAGELQSTTTDWWPDIILPPP